MANPRHPSHYLHYSDLKFCSFTKVRLLWHFLAEPPEVLCGVGVGGGGGHPRPRALLYEGALRRQVVLAGREGGGGAGGEGRLGGVGGEPGGLVLLRLEAEGGDGGGHAGVAAHRVLAVHRVVRGRVAGRAVGRRGGRQGGGDGGDRGHDGVHRGGRLQAAHVEAHRGHAGGGKGQYGGWRETSGEASPGLVVDERGVEAPGEPLGEGGARHLGRPVVVGGVAVARQAVLRERLHQPVELGPEAALGEVCGGVDQVPLPLPPLGATVLEPNLKIVS